VQPVKPTEKQKKTDKQTDIDMLIAILLIPTVGELGEIKKSVACWLHRPNILEG